MQPEQEISEDTEKALALLEADRKRRGEECAKLITDACQKYKCTLLPVTTIRGNQLSGTVEIHPQ